MTSTPAPDAPVNLDDELSFLMARANALSIAAGNSALAPLGLRVRSYSVLALAAGETRPSQREVSDHLRLDPSQVVALVDDLQRRGLVTREPDPRDRRANVVVITAPGRALLDEARPAILAAERELHAGLDDGERRQLTTLLRRVAFPD